MAADKAMRGSVKPLDEKKTYRLMDGAPLHYIGGVVTSEWQGHLPVGMTPGRWLIEVDSKTGKPVEKKDPPAPVPTV